MKAYKPINPQGRLIKRNTGYVAISLQEKLRRITTNKEPITDVAELIYQERKDGIQPSYDPRADKFDIALEAQQRVSETRVANRKKKEEEKKTLGEQAKEGMNKENPETGNNSATETK